MGSRIDVYVLSFCVELAKEKIAEELNANIAELRSSNASLEEKIMKESSEKLVR